MRLFLRCVAESIAEVGFKGLAEMIPGGNYAYSVAEKTLEKWRKKKKDKQQHDEFLALANAKIDEVRNQVAEIVSEVVAQNPQATPPTANEIIDLKLFLEGVPASVRQSLRRVEDPSGTTIPANFDLKEPDDVVKVLPQRPPRFRPNDAVPGKSGWVLERPDAPTEKTDNSRARYI